MGLDGEKNLRARTLDLLQKRAAGEEADSSFLDDADARRAPTSSENQGSPDDSTEQMDGQEANALVLDFAQRIHQGAAHWMDFAELVPKYAKRFSHPSAAWAGFYRAIFDTARMHPELASPLHEMEVDIGTKYQMIGVKQHVAIAADMVWDPRMPQPLRDELLRGLAFAMRGRTDAGYDQEIARHLDFTDSSQFSRTAHMLECLRDVYNMGDTERVDERVRASIERALSENKGSYLLNVRAREILETMDGTDFTWSDRDIIPFELTPGKLAFPKTDGMYLVEQQEEKRVRDDVEAFRAIDRQLRSEYQLSNTVSRSTMRQRQILHASFAENTRHKIDSADVSLPTDAIQAEELHDHAYMLSKPVRLRIKEDFGAEITHLSLREQFRFLNYLKSVDLNNAQNVQEFTKSFGDDGLRTFLVTSSDEPLRKQVFDFAQSVPKKEQADAVFAAYGELVSGIDSMGDYLREAFGVESSEVAESVVAKQLDRARNLLAQAHEYKNNPGQLVALVNSVRADVGRFVDSFRILRQRGELPSAELIKDAASETLFARELAARSHDVERMEMITNQNYATYPETMRTAVVDSFKSSLKRETTRFNMLYHKGEVASFLRFDEMYDDEGNLRELYFGSFNTDKAYGGGQLGEAMFETSFKEELQRGVPITAACNPAAPISQKYIEAGFVAEWLYDFKGVPDLHIVANRPGLADLETKRISKDECIRRAHANEQGSNLMFVSGAQPPSLTRLNDGWIMTRYFFDKPSGTWYSAFEYVGNETKYVHPEEGTLIRSPDRLAA